MEYKKIINLLDSTMNQPSKLRTRNWVEIKDESRERYYSSTIKFKTSVIRSDLCDYSDPYILISAATTINGEGDDDNAKRANKRNKGVILKNCAPFTTCISI